MCNNHSSTISEWSVLLYPINMSIFSWKNCTSDSLILTNPRRQMEIVQTSERDASHFPNSYTSLLKISGVTGSFLVLELDYNSQSKCFWKANIEQDYNLQFNSLRKANIHRTKSPTAFRSQDCTTKYA